VNTNKRNAPEKGFYFIIRTVQRKFQSKFFLNWRESYGQEAIFCRSLIRVESFCESCKQL